jgi:hypothetical protein
MFWALVSARAQVKDAIFIAGQNKPVQRGCYELMTWRCEVYGEYEDQARMQGEDEPEFVTQAPAAEWEPCLEPARHRARGIDRIAHAHSECICLNTHTNTYLSSPRLHTHYIITPEMHEQLCVNHHI